MMSFGFGGLLFMVLVWTVLVLLAVWLVRALFVRSQPPPPPCADDLSVAEMIDRRYAKGDITHEQYELLKHTLSALQLR